MPRNYEQEYRDLLDEIYPEVKIGYLTFSPSRIVEELDPTAFRCGVADFESEQGDEEADND